ncbi:hypothetical protein RE474_07440 [Methanolobus sediminis]|uniref:Uncharacterized protein n=1 Tax=Methanolobus sediminis TaxID=3072978 RepID=A0AA51YHY3_9EURY|nr:hypothetical protein [Methanolobus sediminis]WMW23936.1 hypothetical protein RE474_07440 [Methanolobus sediminis]
MLVIPASATYEWDNSINIQKDSMTWGYTEKYSGDRSIIFKKYVDMEFGDDDGFVSAWELLKADVAMSKSFKQAIEKNMDVKIDNSSKNVILLDVETDISPELLGLTGEERDIVNKYEVYYDFRVPLDESGSVLWFQGEPETDVTISLPEKMKLLSVDGVDNESVNESSKETIIQGKFGFTGEVAIEYSIVEEKPAVEKGNDAENVIADTTNASSEESKKTRIEDFFERLFSTDSDEILKKLKLDGTNYPDTY